MPAEPKTYDAGCISDRGVIARSTMIITASVRRDGLGEGGTESVEWRGTRREWGRRTKGRAEVDEDEAFGNVCELARREAVLPGA